MTDALDPEFANDPDLSDAQKQEAQRIYDQSVHNETMRLARLWLDILSDMKAFNPRLDGLKSAEQRAQVMDIIRRTNWEIMALAAALSGEDEPPPITAY